MSPVAEHLVVIAIHAAALGFSLGAGGAFTGWLLNRLRLVNADLGGPGALGAGRVIGVSERFLVYMAVAFQVPTLLAVLVGVKTIVRYPEVRVAAERRRDGPPGSEPRFAEYYLVGTLVSIAIGVASPLLAKVALAWLLPAP
ncbi:MAG: hypothetical protein ACQEXJ_05755 [Myxococcota bacterium]